MSPRPLYDLEVGAAVVVRPRNVRNDRAFRGLVTRVTTSFLFVQVGGAERDSMRVARSSGRGTWHQHPYDVEPAEPQVLARIDRQEATERLQAALFQVGEAVRTQPEPFAATALEELRELERRLRLLVPALPG